MKVSRGSNWIGRDASEAAFFGAPSSQPVMKADTDVAKVELKGAQLHVSVDVTSLFSDFSDIAQPVVFVTSVGYNSEIERDATILRPQVTPSTGDAVTVSFQLIDAFDGECVKREDIAISFDPSSERFRQMQVRLQNSEHL
ncbi:MAG: hypothetical protein JST30_07795 [Armatimonadetes bacterium]|nr:hypothetical protein [Armatimonadota bacterium]